MFRLTATASSSFPTVCDYSLLVVVTSLCWTIMPTIPLRNAINTHKFVWLRSHLLLHRDINSVLSNIDLPMNTICYQLTYLFLGRWSTVRPPQFLSRDYHPTLVICFLDYHSLAAHLGPDSKTPTSSSVHSSLQTLILSKTDSSQIKLSSEINVELRSQPDVCL